MKQLGLISIFVVACGGGGGRDEVGRLCTLTDPAAPSEIVVVTSSECPGNACLHIGGTSATSGLCTAACDSDTDCAADTATPCLNGFTCGIAQVVGSGCCEKLCICRDNLGLESGSAPVPPACDAANPDNACCNLEGRANDPQRYPLCS